MSHADGLGAEVDPIDGFVKRVLSLEVYRRSGDYDSRLKWFGWTMADSKLEQDVLGCCAVPTNGRQSISGFVSKRR